MDRKRNSGSSLLKRILPIILLLLLYALGGGKLLEKLQPSDSVPASGGNQSEAGALVKLPRMDSSAQSSHSRQEADKESGERVSDTKRVYRAEEVAAYLRVFGELPDGYLTKEEAYELGWIPEDGNLWEVAPGASIGGDSFGNREGQLPRQEGRQYFEADVNYEGGIRGQERIVYSDDGLIFYTRDHYASFVDVTENFDRAKR